MRGNRAKEDLMETNRPILRTILPALLAGAIGCGAALANPAGMQVMNGQATATSQGTLLSIENTPGAILQWQQFSIGAGETTRFVQQSANSSVLNRVVGQDPTQILGALQSNGRVFLVNPNGILFGQGARVDVNGLAASTLAMRDDDFLAGRMRFGGAGGGHLSNRGTITTPSGGRILLAATTIDNSGILTAPDGEIVLAAGHSVQLADASDPNLHVVLSAPAEQALNLGRIIARGGRIGIYGALVSQRGVVEADSAVRGANGNIVLRSSGAAAATAPVSAALLPTLEQCVAAPATPGCQAVLPTPAQCRTAPTTPGCRVVLGTAVSAASQLVTQLLNVRLNPVNRPTPLVRRTGDERGEDNRCGAAPPAGDGRQGRHERPGAIDCMMR
jgi:filamentous hemagglutinin family protein